MLEAFEHQRPATCARGVMHQYARRGCCTAAACFRLDCCLLKSEEGYVWGEAFDGKKYERIAAQDAAEDESDE